MSRIQRLETEPVEPGNNWECLLNTEHTKDGVQISGHAFKDVVAFHDLDTDRWYSVLVCMRCNYPSVAWVEDGPMAQEMIAGHGFKQEVGGE